MSKICPKKMKTGNKIFYFFCIGKKFSKISVTVNKNNKINITFYTETCKKSFLDQADFYSLDPDPHAG